MPLLGGSNDSLYELLSRGRQNLASMAKKAGAQAVDVGVDAAAKGAEAAVKGTAAAIRSAVKKPSPVTPPMGGGLLGLGGRPLERVLEGLLEIDEDPVLVVDDEFDPLEAAKEEREAEERSPWKTLSLRQDTAVVAGVALTLLIAIAYFAGRSTKRPEDATAKSAPAGVLPAPPPAPAAETEPAHPIASKELPASFPSRPAPTAAAVKPGSDEVPDRQVKDGTYELQVVSTSEEKAKKVVDFLNEDAKSPLFGRSDLQAYVRNGSAVRIRGFEKMDDAVLAKIHAMKDPTGGGRFSDACFYRTSKKPAGESR
jgi:hypothetical protein